MTPTSVLELFRLDGKVAIVTGASSGLGVAIAVGLAEAGADLVLTARRLEGLRQTQAHVERLGRRAVVVQTDVGDPAACASAAQAAVDRFGTIDILINNAGIATAVPALREAEDDFRRVLEVNLFGAYWMAQEAARVMSPGASIINISSVLSLITATQPVAAYTASKAAINGLTRDLAQQWTGRRGIRVNAIAPGYFVSDMTDQLRDDYLNSLLSRIPSGRMGDARELAAVVVWLASPAAGYMTGQVVVVDGGFSIA
ncbi:glucose 1-dehydrogenase [Baekduia soli]|uniref:Glucose 1-dehydrogenase n=1 Tax=Baekduia soli TaxID=496014 RepID=A0A5B8U775_9ACTN|nr:glucose 1-dehydrogenase [Baekduia soli]QEC48956.1 glucose 1-dehydrogenase [Baekduia soli]